MMGIALLAVASAALWLSRKEPVYEATAQVLISPLPASEDVFIGLQLLRQSDDPTRVAQTAAALLDAVEVSRQTAARVGPGYSGPKVQQDVDVEPLGESNLIAVTARASAATLAANLANEFAGQALASRRQVLKTQVADRVRALDADATDEERRQLRQLQTIVQQGDPTLALAQPAVVPVAPTGPSEALVLVLAAIAGIGIGAGAAILMEATNRKVRDPREFLDTFPLPVLARIPAVSRVRMLQGGLASMPPAVHEAYRTLQVQVEQAQVGAPEASPAILVTSANAGDGKTSSAIQLALALARDERRVILMDFDLRKPQVGNAFGLPASAGIVSLLTGRRQLFDVLVSPADLPDLKLVTAGGGEDDALLLASVASRLPQILQEARELADYVILDTPPIGEVSDALRLLPYVDDVIIVARPNNTQRADFEVMRDMLERMTLLPLGLVLVGVGSLRARYRPYGAPPERPSPGLPVERRSG